MVVVLKLFHTESAKRVKACPFTTVTQLCYTKS